MKKMLLGAVALALMTGSAMAQDRVQVGRLACDVDAGIGLVLGSQKDMTCVFHSADGWEEVYDGTITKLGLDVGFTAATHIEWLVFSGSTRDADERSLAGTYVGGSSEATLGVGLGANWLIGGSRSGFALQPLSVQAQAGLNISMAFAELELY